MKKTTFGGISLALVCGLAGLALQYDRWFVYPALRAHVNNQMKDPASTQYRNESLTEAGWLCGEMNSKNSMGAYVGFKRFIARSADDAYLDGYGYVGKDVSTARLIEYLDIKTAMIRARLDLQKAGGASKQLSEAGLDEMTVKEIFEKRWQEICR